MNSKGYKGSWCVVFLGEIPEGMTAEQAKAFFGPKFAVVCDALPHTRNHVAHAMTDLGPQDLADRLRTAFSPLAIARG